jgi:hypothetical protein
MKMPALAHAQKWLATHHTQALAAGGAGVVGFALYKRHQNSAGGTASTTPATATTPDSSVGVGDPSSAGSTLSDVDAALLDSDLTGISGQLDAIKTTLANLNPVRKMRGKPAGLHPGGKLPTAKKAKKAKRKPAPKKHAPAPKRTKPPATKADQHRRFATAARNKMKTSKRPATSAPIKGHAGAVANPRPATPVLRRRTPTPAATLKPGTRVLAPLAPRPASKFIPRPGPVRR